MVRSAKDLDVFKKANKLTINLYKETKKFPRHEKYGIINQLRRAAVSINSNLMEGYHRNGLKEFRQFIEISKGSAGEL